MLQEIIFSEIFNEFQRVVSFVSEMHWGDQPRWVCCPTGRRHAHWSVLPLHGSPTCPNAWAGKMFPFPFSPFVAVIMVELSKSVLKCLACSKQLYSFCGSDFAWNYPFREDAFHMFLIFRGNTNLLPSMTNTFPWQTLRCTAGEHRLYWAEGIVYYSRRITSQRTFYLYIFFFSPSENFLLQLFMY